MVTNYQSTESRQRWAFSFFCLLSAGKLSSLVCLALLIILAGCKARAPVTVTPQMDVEPQFWVRVLLLDDSRSCILKIAPSFTVLDLQTGQKYGNCYYSPDKPIIVEVSNEKLTIDRTHFGNEVIILPNEPHIFTLNGNNYRGKLKLIVNPDGNSFDAINQIPLEPYLAGVVGAEMPDYWEEEALAAQAIAARTYCLYIKKHYGSKRAWDVRKTEANQVYLGVVAESQRVWQVLNKTYGKVLVCNYPDGREDIFPAYYSSTCGGHTESSKNVFGQSFEPLVGVECPYCKNVAKLNFFFWPMVQFDKEQVSNKLLQRYPKLRKLGEIINIIVAKQSNYGKFSRLILVKLVGSTGKSDILRAEDLRLSIDPTGRKIKSTVCQIVNMKDKWAFILGRGWGHGVGMCQCGAEGMAREGKTAEQILSYYYPGAKIVRVY